MLYSVANNSYDKPRRTGPCAGGHVTGYFAGGSREGLQRAQQTQCSSWLTHLAKLNPNCHMNYLIIFTEISSSPETSSYEQKIVKSCIGLYNSNCCILSEIHTILV